MSSPYIDFISAYCDGWCERCPFTERCSAFACRVAIGMCGDVAAGLELAVGSPAVPDDAGTEPEGLEKWLPEWKEPTQSELDDFARQADARRGEIERQPIVRLARRYRDAVVDWLQTHGDRCDGGDPLVREAISVVGWDVHLIEVKLRRALDGKMSRDEDDDFVDEQLRDANGSAKVALLSIDRSAKAWGLLASALNDSAAETFAQWLEMLFELVVAEFPRAMSFRRPGFDDAAR